MLCQLCEDRLHLYNKNVSLSALQFCIVLGLHYLCFAKIGCTSTIKMQVFQPFILYCARFALSLHIIYSKYSY